jgi:MFS family permease
MSQPASPVQANRRTFLALAVTQTLSLIGSRMTAIGVGLWVFTRTGDTAPLLLIAFLTEIPGVLGSGLAGVIVDRYDRRRALILSDAGQALGTLLMLLSVVSGAFHTWHLYAIALIQGTFALLQAPARDAATTMLVPAEQRERANGILEMAFPVASAIASVLSGVAYARIGIAGIIAFDLLTFVVAVLVVSLVRIPRPAPTAAGRAGQGSVWRELTGSLRFLVQRRALFALVLYFVLLNFLLNGPLEVSLPYLISVTGDSALTGSLMGVAGLGATAGAVLMVLWRGTRPRMHTILSGMLLCGAMFLLYGTARTPLLLGVSSFVLMATLPVAWALFTAILQRKAPPDMQGRIFGALAQLQFVGATASFLITGPLVDRVLEPAVRCPPWRWVAPLVGSKPGAGMGLLLVATGVAILAATTALYAAPAIRRIEADLPDYEASAAGGTG